MRILVIKHGALGDLIQAFAACAAIRSHHPGAAITLLTTPPFAGLMAASPWFDNVETDSRPAFWQVKDVLALRRRLRGFGLVYDLQTSSRSTRYFRLAGRPPWSGIAPGCAFAHDNKARATMHTRERLADQLRAAGVTISHPPDLSWLLQTPPAIPLPNRFAVLAPGAALHRPEKRWPATHYGALARQLNMPAVIIGSADETPLADAIRSLAPAAIDLTGRTALRELAAIIAKASLAVGNDTGPMHLATALGVPAAVLFSRASNPALTAPRYPDGGWPLIFRADDLSDLPVERVAAACHGGIERSSVLWSA